MSSNIPTCRWGIVTTGLISSWFVEDLVLSRSDAKAKHIVQAIGSSSLQKAKDFASKYCPESSPNLYDNYTDVYKDPNVDCVYIGTPHAFHRQNCLDSLSHLKPTLCEKAFTLNAREANEVISLARANQVYLHEAMWLRHRPLVLQLQQLLHHDKIIGDIFRVYSDFSLDIDITQKPMTSRYRDPALGAGSLLDIGIYSLTWGILALDPKTPHGSEMPDILATQTFTEGVEVTTSILLKYPSSGAQGIITSTTNGLPTENDVVARIEGSKGHVIVHGPAASLPLSFTVCGRKSGDKNVEEVKEPEGKHYDFPEVGRGFIYEADNTAVDIAEGRKESEVMPLDETLRVMQIMDEVRRQGGTKYAVD